jgi:hypothetical protein
MGQVPGLAQHRAAGLQGKSGVKLQEVDHAMARTVIVGLGEDVQAAIAPEAEGVRKEPERRLLS